MSRSRYTPRERRHRAIHAFIDRDCPVSALTPGTKVPVKSCPQCDIKSPDYVRHHGIKDCPHKPDMCHGFHAATLDHDKAQSWIDRYPDLNFAISTGPAGLVIVDLDTNKNGAPVPDKYANIPGVKDGYDVWSLALERYGARHPTDTMQVSTPNGGLHIWHSLPPGVVVNKSEGAFGWLVDIRSTNSYIIGPTSVTKDGEYRRLGDVTEPTVAPDWLLHHLEHTGHKPKPPARPRPRIIRQRSDQDDREYRGKTVQDLAHELATAQETERHAVLVRVTAAAAYLVHRGLCDEAEMRDAMYDAGRDAQRTDYEIHKAIESALSYTAGRAA
ncbi:bifunctional DNA primase/polymerase [Streptomyces sp. 020-2-3H-GM]|uniref:bifunctional DNA primase/polymerase n=1 Tax=Streptomyces sp. 020-2-3H-GM TaxID=2789258 RepID=UPI0039809890